MVNTYTGLNFRIFDSMADKYGSEVSRVPITLSLSNIEGDETMTRGTTATLQVYIVRKARPWKFDNSGMIEGGDAVMLVKEANTVNRHDQIIWNGNTYRVETVLNRDQAGGNVYYKSCNLFLLEDS
jgi:hypothetical protein